MADVTYIRVSASASTPVSGESGTWIPLTDARLATAPNSASGTATFSLADDDAIADTLGAALFSNRSYRLEFATYDTSTATPTSAGTLISYAVSPNATISAQEQNGGAQSFTVALPRVSVTTYPSGPSGPASSAAFNFANPQGAAPAPMPVPSDVASGSIASAISKAPTPATLTYYAQFATAAGTYVANADGGTWFAISTPTSALGDTAADPLSFSVSDATAVTGLLGYNANNPLYAIHVEGVANGAVIDNTTFGNVALTTLTNNGAIDGTPGTIASSHTTAAGVTTSYASSSKAVSIAAAPPNDAASPAQSTLYFSIDDVQGDTNLPPTTFQYNAKEGGSSGDAYDTNYQSAFSISSLDYSEMNSSRLSGSRILNLTSSDGKLGVQLDSALFNQTRLETHVEHVSGSAVTEGDRFSEAQIANDAIEIDTGAHSFTIGAIQDARLGSNKEAAASAGSSQPSPSQPTYVQFKDAHGIITSANGQSWFAASAASATIQYTFGSSTPLIGLYVSLGNDAPSAALDADLVAGVRITTEVAVYTGSGSALQADYVFSNANISTHASDPAGGQQAIAFTGGSYQESYYATGQATASLSYDAATNKATMSAPQTTSAPATAPTNAPAATASNTYVQFLDGKGQAIAGSGGQTWFQVPSAASTLVTASGGGATLSPLTVQIGNDQIAGSLDAASLNGAGVSTVNVASFANNSLQTYQRFTGAAVTGATTSDTGGDHTFTISYTGYGESMPGATPLNAPANAAAGTNPSVPGAADEVAASAAVSTATEAPSLSTLSFYAKLDNGGTDVFAGTSSGFRAVGNVSVDLIGDSASFSVDAGQASSLLQPVASNTPLVLEIAGYDSGGRAIDYVLSGVRVSNASADPTTGLEQVTASFTSIEDTSNSTSTGPAYAMDAPADAPPAVCFASGTRIRTARGDVAVEALVVGDLAVTASGEHRPIRWIGSRLTHPRRHPRPHEAMPVRVVAHAFGPNRPARDLLVSPGHSLCVDVVGEVLIPTVALVNGTTITQDDVEHVTYWHVELDGHDVLLAENMPAESYIEMGNRGFFAESEVVALDASPDAPVVTHADFCRPFHAEGALVDVVRAQLAARAARLGWRLEQQGLGDLHLLVDGARIEPRVRGLAARFAVPAGASAVWLVSSTSVPAEIAAGSTDRRSLGVCVAALTVDDGFGAPRGVAVDDPRLCVGFHPVERDGDTALRWTAGRARLPASLWEGMDHDTFLRVDLARPALPRWIPFAALAEDEKKPVAMTA